MNSLNLVEKVIPNVVRDDQNSKLIAIPSFDEVKAAFFSMDLDSSPELDGFGGCFYRVA